MASVLSLAAPLACAKERTVFEEARIIIEYNASDNDLGFHVFIDGEDWKTLRIIDPNEQTIFKVEGKGGYKDLGASLASGRHGFEVLAIDESGNQTITAGSFAK